MRLAPLALSLCFLLPSASLAGTLTGTVQVRSAAPARASVQPYAGRASSLPSAAPTAHGLASDAVVSIAALPAAIDTLLPWPSTRARLMQKDQAFVPRVVAVPRGDRVEFPNMDPIFHNVFSVSPAKRFDLGKYPKPQSRTVRFDKPGVVNVFCDIHADMAAYIVVLPNRAFTQPDAQGRYRLPPLPAGRYTLSWWHPDFGSGQREVTVPASGDVTADVEF